MDARKAIEEGGSYLLVMTDWWKKLDKADAEKMQKGVHWKDCEEETCKLNRRESELSRVYKSKYQKTIKTRASIPSSKSGRQYGIKKVRIELGIYRNYTMKSLILAQDER